jgi:protein arginine kinase activator
MAENLKCSICNKDATVHLTQIVNNKIHKVDLCESCAQKKGVTDPEGFSLADLVANTLSPVLTEEQQQCPACGHTTAEFRRTGRLGCAECYKVFHALVLPVLEDMHAGTSHQGKVPQVALSRQSIQMRLKQLKESLARSVADEAYEQAAELRDQIKAIEEAENLEVSSK